MNQNLVLKSIVSSFDNQEYKDSINKINEKYGHLTVLDILKDRNVDLMKYRLTFGLFNTNVLVHLPLYIARLGNLDCAILFYKKYPEYGFDLAVFAAWYNHAKIVDYFLTYLPIDVHRRLFQMIYNYSIDRTVEVDYNDTIMLIKKSNDDFFAKFIEARHLVRFELILLIWCCDIIGGSFISACIFNKIKELIKEIKNNDFTIDNRFLILNKFDIWSHFHQIIFVNRSDHYLYNYLLAFVYGFEHDANGLLKYIEYKKS